VVSSAVVAVDRVAGLEPRDRGADGLDRAGDVPAEHDGEVVGELVREVALADLVVDGIEPGRADADEHPVGGDGRRLDLEQLHPVAAAPFVDGDGAHCVGTIPHSRA
jgi:hypothetical protein